jgi:hypothetical protein
MAEATHLLGLPVKHKPSDIKPQGAGSGLDTDMVDGCHAGILGNNVFKILAAIASGDIFYVDSTPQIARLPKGSDGQVLTLVSGLPAWQAAGGGAAHNILSSTHPDTLPDSVVAGDIIYGNATPKWARLPKSADGNFLKLVSGLPGWNLLAAADIPSLDTSKITTGRFTADRLLDGTSGYFLKAQGSGVNPLYALLTAADIPSLPASQITSGRFSLSRLPDGTSGYLLTAQGSGSDPAYAAPATIGKGIKYYLGSNQSVGAGATVYVALNTKVFDDYSEWNTSTYYFQPATSGKYFIAMGFSLASLTTSFDGTLFIHEFQDQSATDYLRLDTSFRITATGRRGGTIAGTANLTAGTKYYVMFTNNGSGSVTLSSGETFTWIVVFRLF